jgi:hypothetical protein
MWSDMVGIVESLLLQIIFTVGLIAGFGLLVRVLNKVFYKLMGSHARTVCMATGFIGTPIHEIGHAFFCVVFGHKVVEIKLYQPNSDDGFLGYVKHTYNKRNIYHQIGNFFIGIGPVIFGSGVLLLLMLIFVPGLLSEISDTMSLVAMIDIKAISFSAIGYIIEIIWEIAVTFFGISSLTNPLWWLFMIPACSIALHMSISVPDIKHSVIGFTFIATVLLIVNIVLYFASVDAMWTLTDWCLRISAFILNFLMISILFSLILILIGLTVKGIKKLLPIKK